MNVETKQYVVGIVENGAVVSYYAIEPNTGGYPYFPKDLRSAEFFAKEEDAVVVAVELGAQADTPQQPDRDGTICPHADIKRALGISNAKKSAKGEAVVFKVIYDLQPLKTVAIHGEIKKPTGYTYD
jgi:hypothetical protein